ncbi:hypothetical protein FRX31_006310 [Thalictrum thalictroides]|uniref:Dof-type domain-containing protein n=1 Tax=Thalictrum thalictroides TaxID=46969 RepID=A0A7J6X5G2_THATH|nr:hypothetical protein FRX31_006310 [Thalictrum thalictroides]
MGAVENQQQQHGEEKQLVEVHTDPPRQCPRCNSWETMFGYYNNYSDNQPSYHCKICSHYWAHGEVPGDISEVPSTSTNRVCKIPHSVENPILGSSSSVRTNRQCDPISRNLSSEEEEIYNPSSLMRINEPMALHTSLLAPAMQSVYTMTPGSGLLSSVFGGVNQYLHPHGHPQQPRQQQQQQQQQLSDEQNFCWNGVVSQMPSVDQIPIPSVLPSITPLEMTQGLNNENNAVGLQPVSWNTNVSGLQSQVTHVLHSTTVMVFQQSVYSVSSVSGQTPVLPVLPSINPWELPQGFIQGNNSLGLEAESWNSNTWQNSSNTGELQSQLTPIQNTTIVPPFQQILHNVGSVIDIEDVLWTNNSLNNSDDIGGFPVNPNFRPDRPNL